MSRRERDDEDRSPSTAGRKTLGPPPRPGSRYSFVVGLVFLVLVIVAGVNTLTSREAGTLGFDQDETDLPLPEFAIPVALSDLEGDANVAQDDCETSELPCPEASRRKPACRINPKDAIRICDFFDRPLVISFWFTRGGNCEEQQDVVSNVYERFRGRVNFVSVNVRDDRDTVRSLIREHGWKMPVGVDRDGAVANIYRVGGCPTFVFAYPGGILDRAPVGQLSEAALIRGVRALERDSARREAAG